MPLTENSMMVPQIKKIRLWYDPAISLLSISPKELKVSKRKYLNTHVKTLNSGQEVEVIQESTEGKDTENVYTSGVIFFSLEKGREFWHVKTLEEPWGHYLK